MKKQTDNSKIKKDEVISDENSELTAEELEQVDGGYGKHCYYSTDDDRSASYTSSSDDKSTD